MDEWMDDSILTDRKAMMITQKYTLFRDTSSTDSTASAATG